MIYFIRNLDLYIVLNMVTIYNYAFTMHLLYIDCAVMFE